jgi:hypothetical protein
MAAFSTLGLIAAGVIAGGAASKLATRKKNDPAAPLAPGPTDANAATLQPPAPPIVNPGDANAAGLAAGAKQRKRASGGSLLTNRIGPPSTLAPMKARTAPRTLLGS